MNVSICIVNWNTKDLLHDCIKSIKEKTSGIDYEIIIVDNASSDGSVEMIRHTFPDCKLIASDQNLGFVKGNNLAIKEASGKYIVYLNPDTTLVTNAITGMHNFLENNREYGAIGCKLIDQNGNIQYTCAAAFPTPFNTLSPLLLLDRIFPKSKLFAARELDYWNHEDSRDVECLSGACIMTRKNIIDDLGGFDENIFMYSEDIDLCYQILRRNWNIFYLASEIIIHHEGASTRKKKNRNFAPLMQKASNYYFIRKNFGQLKATQFRIAVCIGSLFRIILMTLLYPLLIIIRHSDSSVMLSKHFYIFLWSIRNRIIK